MASTDNFLLVSFCLRLSAYALRSLLIQVNYLAGREASEKWNSEKLQLELKRLECNLAEKVRELNALKIENSGKEPKIKG